MNRKRVPISLAVLALCAGMAYWLWPSPGRTASVNAVVEGRLTAVSVSIPGTVKEVYVHAGDMVSRDQPLLALDPSGYESRLAEERGRLAEIAVQLLPGLLVTAPNASPVSPGKPLEALRDEEEDARKKVEAAAHIYAAANLDLSRLSAGRPGEYARTDSSRQAALIARDEAAIALKKAKDAYEKFSYARAHREVQDRVGKSGGHVSAALAARIAEYEAQLSRVRIAEQSLAATVLTAPENGWVALLSASRGSQVVPGDAPVVVVPDDSQELWVMAFFSAENASNIAKGQNCEIRLKGGGAFKGKVGRVVAADGAEKDVAVRVILDQNTLPDGLAAGQAVSVSVLTGRSGVAGQVLDSILHRKP